jgi:hypothetical protein
VSGFVGIRTQLGEPARTALQETIDNTDPATLTDYRILAGVSLVHFRTGLLALIRDLDREQLAAAIASQLLVDLWPQAVVEYKASSGYRVSEKNFSDLITPFAGRLNSQEHDQLLDAIIQNGQNWDASETDTLLLGVLRNAPPADQPTHDARNRFYQHIRRMRRIDKYADVITLLKSDGWILPAPDEEVDD